MRRTLAIVSTSVAAAFLTACGSMNGVPHTSPALFPAMRVAKPDLSTKNYVAMYPVAETGSYIATGSDGDLWFTTQDYVASIDTSGNETYYSNSGGFATHIAAGKTGTLWFTDLNGDIGRITTAGVITTFAVAGASKTLDIAKGPDGDMWFTDQGSHSIGKITAAGVGTLYAIPSGATPIGITAGPDGDLWFSAVGGPNVQEFAKATTTGTITEYPIPAGDSGQPGAMVKGPDGNLYATSSSGGLYAVTTAGAAAYYPTSFSSSFEDGIAVGPDKEIWISPGDSADDLTEFNTMKHVFSKAAQVPTAPFCSPGLSAIPRGLALGPDGDMWFVTENCAYVGVYEESISNVGIRLTGESSFDDPDYGFELGYFNGTNSMTSETVMLSMGESVKFQNVDTEKTHTASFLGDATANSAPWPTKFDGKSAQSPAGTVISTTGFSTGPLAPGKSSLDYETGLPGFYMFGCFYHYNSNMMRTVIVVH